MVKNDCLTKNCNAMAFDYTLLVSFFEECNIPYQIDPRGVVLFDYSGQRLYGSMKSTIAFESCMRIHLVVIDEISPFDVKRYLKIINQLNVEMHVVKFIYHEETKMIFAVADVPLDSSPELDDLIPGIVNLLVDAVGQFEMANQM